MTQPSQTKNQKSSIQKSGNGSGKLIITWDSVDVRKWDAWMERITPFPIEQTWCYGQAFAGVSAPAMRTSRLAYGHSLRANFCMYWRAIQA